jgi:tripartite-type tricarboxylate transporter receptor subunit TctC
MAAPAAAQTRNQPVRLVFPFGAGGLSDTLTRTIADQLSAGLGRPVVVEARPGAGGRIGVRAVKTAEPDGNTLLLTPIAPMTVYQGMYPSLEYDPVRDFVPITQLATFEFAIAVGKDIPATTLAELVAWIRANPEKANYGMPGAGTLPHFFGAMFARAIGAELQPVAYNGTPALLADLVGGRIPLLFHATNELVEMHKAGAIRILATSDRRRSPFLPDVPTFRESTYDLEGTGWYGLFAPASTSAETVARINAIMVGALARPEVRDRLLALGLLPSGTSPEEFARIQRRDIELWAPAVKGSGFTPAL